MTMAQPRPGRRLICSLCGLVVSSGACNIDPSTLLLDLDSILVAEDPTPSVTERPDDVVTLRFRNSTLDEAVDVEFYATNEPLANIPDDLFVPQNLVTASLGVAGTGIVTPLREDLITFPCSLDLTIGTLGGRFLDNETGEARGQGVRRWLEERPLGLCGTVVTFEYAGDDGVFTTILQLGE